MTLLTICNNAASEVDLNPFTTIVSNSDPGAVKLLRYAGKVGDRLMKVCEWQILRKEKTFTGVSGSEQTSILPADFDRFVPETFWNRSSEDLIAGPISSTEWQDLTARSHAGRPKFILRGGSVFIIPVLAGGESLAFEYVSKNWCQSSGATAQNAWAADTDTGILDEELITLGVIYEYLVGEGLPTGAAADAYTDRYRLLVKNDQPRRKILVAGDIFATTSRHYTGEPSSNGFELL